MQTYNASFSENETKSIIYGKYVSNVIQRDIAWVWLMKHVQDNDPVAVQKVHKIAAPHVSRVNIDIDE